MSKSLRDIRLMPIVLLAIVCLFVLKSMGLFFDGGYTLGDRLGGSGTLVVTTVPIPPVTQMRSPAQPLQAASSQQGGAQPSFMQQKFGYPGGGPAANAKTNSSINNGDVAITGSVPNKSGDKLAEKRDEKAEAAVPPAPESIAARGTVVAMEQQRPASAGERALLERLQERRQELDARARELDLRESLIKAAEKKLETQAATQEAEKNGPNGQRKEENDNARFKGVVTMYETMKPKEAAKIFDRLDPKVLIEVASQIKPQRMSEIMAQMSPEAAERLTVEMATRGPADRTLNPANLPKIDGRPGG
jgi:flagellar motility protein MotE (MotC chaperone)